MHTIPGVSEKKRWVVPSVLAAVALVAAAALLWFNSSGSSQLSIADTPEAAAAAERETDLALPADSNKPPDVQAVTAQQPDAEATLAPDRALDEAEGSNDDEAATVQPSATQPPASKRPPSAKQPVPTRRPATRSTKNTASKNTASKNTASKNTASKNTASKNTASKSTSAEVDIGF